MSNRGVFLNYTVCISLLPKTFRLLSYCLLPPPFMDCPTLFSKPTVDWARLTVKKKKKTLLSHTRKIPFTKWQFSCNHPIQASFIAASLLLFHFFNFRLCTQIYYANFDYTILTESYM